MIKTVATNRYEKELKLMIKRGKDLNKLDHLLEILEANINKKWNTIYYYQKSIAFIN